MDTITYSCPPTAPDTPEFESTGWSLIHLSAEVALAQTLALGPHSARQSHNGPGPGVDLLFQLSPVSTQDLKVADPSI